MDCITPEEKDQTRQHTIGALPPSLPVLCRGSGRLSLKSQSQLFISLGHALSVPSCPPLVTLDSSQALCEEKLWQ